MAIAETLRDCLAPQYAAELAGDGTAALASLARSRPALVLLDMNMPGLSGLDVLSRIRATAPTVPVIMVTATEDHASISAALRLGAFGYIPKPFSEKYIRHLVAAAIPPTS